MAARKDLPPPPPARPHPEWPGVMIVPISGGSEVLLDQEDYETWGGVRWSTQASERSRMTYAQRHDARDGVRTTTYLHRLRVDHENRNGLDCRRLNLRAATKAQNTCNSEKRRDNASGFKGVSWHGAAKRWVANIKAEGRQIYLGLYDDPALAARRYDAEATKHFGTFACLNFPEVTE